MILHVDLLSLFSKVNGLHFISPLGIFPFPLYDAAEIERIQSSGDDREVYKLALLVLLGCLQTPSAVLFMDAALTLEVNMQREILHLIEEPMRCIQGDSPLTRERLLSTITLQPKSPESRNGFHCFAPVEFDQASGQQGQPTPIKSMSLTESDNCHSRTASQPPHEDADWVSGRLPPDGVDLFRTGLGEPFTTSSPLVQDSNQIKSLDNRKTIAPKTASMTDQPSSAVNGDTSVPNHRRPTSLSVAVSADEFLMPPPPPPPPVSTHSRPIANSQQSPTPGSDSASVPAMSPLANIRSLVESPLWSNKARLREAERGLRELRRELAQSRAEREDAEHTCMELRREVAACQERARVAEAEAAQLRREAAVWRDQNDELDEAKSELLLQGEENRALKQRLADAQAIAARVRELEVANEDLRRQMEEKDEKVTSLLQKLSEVKERRIMNAEIEKLRWRLKEAEERLAQELQEREAVEAEARNQQSVFQQMRVERRVAEKLRKQQQQESLQGKSTALQANGLIQAAADTTGLNNHEDSNPPMVTSFDVSLVDHSSLVPSLPNHASVGENLGSVFQRENEKARAHITELEHEIRRLRGMSEASAAEVERLTEALARSCEEANSQETALRLAEDAKLESDCALKRLLDDLDTVEARLAWSASPAAAEATISLASLPNALEMAGQGLAVSRLTDFLLHLSGCVGTAWSRKDAVLTELRSQSDTARLKVDELSARLEAALTEKRLTSEALAGAGETIETLQTELAGLQETTRPPQTTSRDSQTDFSYLMADCEVQTIPEDLDYDVETSELGTEEIGPISSECEEMASIVDTSEALADDRRHLSGEIVRLNDELKDARDLLESRQTEFDEVMEKLRCSLRDLEYERAFSDQARQNWMQCDREARELKNQLTSIEDDFAAQQEALQKILAPVSRLYTHLDPLACISSLVSDFLAERHKVDERFSDVCAENDRLKHRLLDLQAKLDYDERIRRELAVLGERSRLLESEATRLRQHVELNNSSRASVSRNFSSPARHFADDQDTDLDTSEYTDLSQVSWANEKPPRKQHRRHTAMALTTPVQNGERSCSSSRAREPPSARRSETSNRRATELSRHTESSRPKNTNSNEPPAEDLLSRVTELRRRNELQPFHMRTNYPIETQLCNPDELLTALKSVHIQRELSAHAATGVDCTESAQPPSSAASTAGSFSPRKTSAPADSVMPAGRSLKPRGAQSISEVLLTGSSGNVGVQELGLRDVSMLSIDRLSDRRISAPTVSTNPAGTSPLHAVRGPSSSSASGRLPLVPEVESPCVAEDGRTASSSRHSAHVRPSSNHPSHEPLRTRSVSSSYDDAALSSTDDQSDIDYPPKQVNKPLAFEVSFSPSTTAPRSRNPPARLTARTPATSQSSLAQTPSLVLTREKNSIRLASNSALRTSSTAEIASATTSGFKVPGPVKTKPLAVTSNGKWAPPSAVAASNSRRPLKETTSRTNRRT
ncbi:hypothetical protein AAHC03_05693 [Spirometra sp. Aus1]